MDLELTGRVAVVTGGSHGIGKAVAQELAREGVNVVVCARHREALEETARALAQATGRRIVPIPTDTTNWESVSRMVETTLTELGRIDILVNNAATPGGLVRGELAEADEGDLLADINTKVVGYFRCAKAVAPHMQQRGWGRIINIGGLSGRRSGVISGMRNAAVVHLTKTLADQLGSHGITVNLVHPGATRTERTGEEAARRAAQANAIHRMVDAQEIAQVVAFLASTKAAAVTGVSIDASGGSIPVVFP
jgi:NAD(P)-dependent dehydrogenase (short-subunit alcohol dehydrogenase family)